MEGHYQGCPEIGKYFGTFNACSKYCVGLTAQVSSCDMCQRINQKQVIEKPELHPIPVHSPWFHIGVDFVGPISPPSTSGNNYILTLSDYFTKWVEVVPLPTKEAHGVANALLKVLL